jgi:galactitol-specific phosphotransferase system IIB component
MLSTVSLIINMMIENICNQDGIETTEAVENVKSTMG